MLGGRRSGPHRDRPAPLCGITPRGRGLDRAGGSRGWVEAMNWLHSAAHARWLEQESDELLTFGAGAMVDDGFGFLDRSGQVELDRDRPLWLTCRLMQSCARGVRRVRRAGCTSADQALDP